MPGAIPGRDENRISLGKFLLRFRVMNGTSGCLFAFAKVIISFETSSPSCTKPCFAQQIDDRPSATAADVSSAGPRFLGETEWLFRIGRGRWGFGAGWLLPVIRDLV